MTVKYVGRLSCLRGGWYSLTVRERTARRVRKEAEARGLSVDEFISSLMTQGSRGPWLTCRIRRARVKPENMDKHVARVHLGAEEGRKI